MILLSLLLFICPVLDMNDCYDPCNHLMFVDQLDSTLSESGLFALIETNNTYYELYLSQEVSKLLGLPKNYLAGEKIFDHVSAEGLQMLNADGEWVDVEVPEGAVLLNVAEELESVSGGRYKPAVVIHK